MAAHKLFTIWGPPVYTYTGEPHIVNYLWAGISSSYGVSSSYGAQVFSSELKFLLCIIRIKVLTPIRQINSSYHIACRWCHYSLIYAIPCLNRELYSCAEPIQDWSPPLCMTYNALYVINRLWKVVQILIRTF